MYDLLTNESKLDLSKSDFDMCKIQFKLSIWQQMWGEGEQIAPLYSCSRTRVTKILELSNLVLKIYIKKPQKEVTDDLQEMKMLAIHEAH